MDGNHGQTTLNEVITLLWSGCWWVTTQMVCLTLLRLTQLIHLHPEWVRKSQWLNYSTLCAVYVQFLNERCFHMFLAFFNKKRHYRLKVDDSVARKKTGGRRREDSAQQNMMMNAAGGEFLQRHVYTHIFFALKMLHREVFIQIGFYT